MTVRTSSRVSHVALDGQRAQEPRDLRRPHLRRVALVVEQDEAPDPAHVGLLGTQAAVTCAQRGADPIE